MTQQVFGLTAKAAKLVKAMADKYRQRLPSVDRRIRRIGKGAK